jgi:DivIVA domain-containing protein
MSSRGQSLSMFVVQRTFTRVRRGYDPDEVDRHLELVSRWFTSTDAGRAIAEERARLRERESEAQHLVEGARVEAEATLEGARLRADADARAAERLLAEARETVDAARIEAAAAERIRAAEEQAAAIREQAGEMRSRSSPMPEPRPSASWRRRDAPVSSCWPRFAPRRPTPRRRCGRRPRTSCGPTSSAAAARPTGSSSAAAPAAERRLTRPQTE